MLLNAVYEHEIYIVIIDTMQNTVEARSQIGSSIFMAVKKKSYLLKSLSCVACVSFQLKTFLNVYVCEVCPNSNNYFKPIVNASETKFPSSCDYKRHNTNA